MKKKRLFEKFTFAWSTRLKTAKLFATAKQLIIHLKELKELCLLFGESGKKFLTE